MKYFLFLLFSFMIQSCLDSNNKSKVKEVTVIDTLINELHFSYMNFDALTTARIPCDQLGQEYIIITDDRLIDDIINQIKALKPNNEFYKTPDVRAKFVICYESNMKEDVCMDALVVLYRGKSYLMSENLRIRIDRLIMGTERHKQ